MYLSTEPPCQCQVYKNTWYKKTPFSVFLLHRLTTCTTPQNTPWVFSATLVSAGRQKFHRTLPAMKCYEIATRPFLADCICIMFEDHPIFYVLPKDLSVETPHFCQALHAPFVASVGLRVAARVHPNYSANRRFHSLQILPWNRVGNFHHLFEKLAFFECKFYLEKTPLQKSFLVFSLPLLSAVALQTSGAAVETSGQSLPISPCMKTKEPKCSLNYWSRAVPTWPDVLLSRKGAQEMPRKGRHKLFFGSLDGQNGRNLLYICCRFSNLPPQTSYVNLAKANDDENVCWHMVHRNKNLY